MDTAASLTQAGVVLGNLGGVVFRPKCLSCERMEGYGTGRGLSLSPAVALFSKVLRAEAGWCSGWGWFGVVLVCAAGVVMKPPAQPVPEL